MDVRHDTDLGALREGLGAELIDLADGGLVCHVGENFGGIVSALDLEHSISPLVDEVDGRVTDDGWCVPQSGRKDRKGAPVHDRSAPKGTGQHARLSRDLLPGCGDILTDGRKWRFICRCVIRKTGPEQHVAQLLSGLMTALRRLGLIIHDAPCRCSERSHYSMIFLRCQEVNEKMFVTVPEPFRFGQRTGRS